MQGLYLLDWNVDQHYFQKNHTHAHIENITDVTESPINRVPNYLSQVAIVGG